MHPVYKEKEADLEYNGYLLWGLIAVELFMSFSFLGYIHIEPISITFVYIPVLVAGCVLGPRESSIVGAVFGLASMWKASAFYVGVGDAVFSPVMSGHPLESILLSVGTRTIFGLIVGLLYRTARRSSHPLIGIVIVTSMGRTMHTVLVYGCMGMFFPEAGFDILDTFNDIMRWDFIPFLFVANVTVLCCYLFRKSRYMTDLLHRLHMGDEISSIVPRYRKPLAVMTVLVLFASVSAALYFTNRIRTVLTEYGLEPEERAAYDIMYLQIQFLLGMMALALIAIIVIIMYQKNFNYLYYEARMDGLTGLFGRELFFQTGNDLLRTLPADRQGRYACFFMLDIDDFKMINDVYGHPAGDGVLKEVAGYMKKIFGGKGVFGRLGGDEFAGLVSQPVTKEEIEGLLNELKEGIGRIQVGDKKITCSIGVIPAEKEYSMESLYKNADRLLYEAKKKGKDRFVFGYRFEEREGKA